MAPPTPQQQLLQDRVEGLIGLAAPFLDLMLAAGDRLARLVSPEDEYVPIRAPADALELEAARRRPAAAAEHEISD
jgi:hypothetical protein